MGGRTARLSQGPTSRREGEFRSGLPQKADMRCPSGPGLLETARLFGLRAVKAGKETRGRGEAWSAPARAGWGQRRAETPFRTVCCGGPPRGENEGGGRATGALGRTGVPADQPRWRNSPRPVGYAVRKRVDPAHRYPATNDGGISKNHGRSVCGHGVLARAKLSSTARLPAPSPWRDLPARRRS